MPLSGWTDSVQCYVYGTSEKTNCMNDYMKDKKDLSEVNL